MVSVSPGCDRKEPWSNPLPGRQPARWVSCGDMISPSARSPKAGLAAVRTGLSWAGTPILVHKTMRARDLFDKIIRQAHHNGEPGMLFLDAANRSNPVPHLYQMEATNPCGEQWLGPYENCCLGSVNLAEMFGVGHQADWEKA